MRLALEALTEQAELRNLLLADAERALGLQINAAGVFAVQLIQFRAHVAPDTCFFESVVDERGAEMIEPALPAKCEELLAPLHVSRVALARMSRFELQFRDIGGLDHGLGVDRHSIFDNRRRLFHGPSRIETVAKRGW